MSKRTLAYILLAPVTIFIVVSLAYIFYYAPIIFTAMIVIVSAVAGVGLLEQSDIEEQ